MATTLQSPGVQVSVVNESFYTPGAPGTVPLLFVATAQDKINPSGVVAPGSQLANAGSVYSISSQRDLTDTFGTPLFYTDTAGNPINGGELNEYGLQAAYSLLGVSSAVYVVRAPVDLASLTAASSAPVGNPVDGTYWVDTANTSYGIFEWNQTSGVFSNKLPIIIDDSNLILNTVSGAGQVPAASVGLIGQYAIIVNSQNTNTVWYKNTDANWVQVGSIGEDNFVNNSDSFVSTTWSTSWPTVRGISTSSVTVSGSLIINGTPITVNIGSINDISTAINNTLHTAGVGAKIVNGALALYADSTAKSDGTHPDGKINIGSGSTSALLLQLGFSAQTYNGPTVFVGPHTQYPDFNAEPSGSVYVKTTNPNQGQNWVVRRWSANSDSFNLVSAPVYANAAAATYNLDKIGGGQNIAVGTLYVESNYDHGTNVYVSSLDQPTLAEFKIQYRIANSPTVIRSLASTGTVMLNTGTVGISVSVPGSSTYTNFQTISVPAGPVSNFVQAINNSGIPNLSATTNANNSISIIHETGGEIRFNNGDLLSASNFGGPGVTANLYALGRYEVDGAEYIASNWQPLTYTASSIAPSSLPANGKLWYSSIVDQVDIMYHNGEKWVGYGNAFPSTDPNGPIVAASAPTTQSDGVTSLKNGDIWISTADLENYGKAVYVWSSSSLSWVLQDVTDSTSPNGWVFADARWATTGQAVAESSIAALRISDYVDPDAPDPALYPRGTRLWNLRRSGFNVKQYVKGYININANGGYNVRVPTDSMSSYNPDRWVSVSPNNYDGSGTFGRLAQRAYVVKSLKSMIDSNTAVRDTDALNFNLIACPGYVETLQNMIALNADRGVTAFVVGDTPFRLTPDATSLRNWGLNLKSAEDNSDVGLVSYDDYTAVWYPSGYTNDLSGNYVVVPPSHMMLRTIILNDQQSYPWFAPAGLRRGTVDNATSVGYIDSQTGKFITTTLPQGTRDAMANAKVNPIATLTGSGLVALAQYTRANSSSALDRINVARLVCYLRRQLDLLSRPYLFEPNDKITRDEIKSAAQSLLLELVSQRALYDFIVVCDESNNTPDRVDRSELWMDIAIEPVKAVEFIYIPLRLVNTGSIKAGTYTLA